MQKVANVAGVVASPNNLRHIPRHIRPKIAQNFGARKATTSDLGQMAGNLCLGDSAQTGAFALATIHGNRAARMKTASLRGRQR